jgi:predicted DNA-binding transcriptional regulator YafY
MKDKPVSQRRTGMRVPRGRYAATKRVLRLVGLLQVPRTYAQLIHLTKCNPRTLRRDVATLRECGFAVDYTLGKYSIAPR